MICQPSSTFTYRWGASVLVGALMMMMLVGDVLAQPTDRANSAVEQNEHGDQNVGEKLLTLIQKEWPIQCTREHVNRVMELASAVNDKMSEGVEEIYEQYKGELSWMCLFTLIEKLKEHNKDFDQLYEFNAFVELPNTNEHEDDHDAEDGYFDRYELYVRNEAKKRSISELEMFKELKASAKRIKNLINENLGAVTMLAEERKADKQTLDQIQELNTLNFRNDLLQMSYWDEHSTKRNLRMDDEDHHSDDVIEEIKEQGEQQEESREELIRAEKYGAYLEALAEELAEELAELQTSGSTPASV